MISAAAALGAQFAAPVFVLPAKAQGPDRAPQFDFEDVVKRARDLVNAPFDETSMPLPDAFANLDFDTWRDLRFREDHALFADNKHGFKLGLYHLGHLFKRSITINTIRDGIAAPIPYSQAMFDYGRLKLDKAPPINTGYAGFRLNYPVNGPFANDEALSFIGVSYFRFLGRGQQYGLSARGLAVENGTKKETFPYFREFWVDTPAAGSNHATIYALLDGEAATGAYRFDFTVGQESTMDVQATIFPRRDGVRFGIAALTSMFMTGENDRHVRDSYRNELHDSDGLLIHGASGEWLWRPLLNPDNRVDSSHFLDPNIRGFGLLQRDRNFISYQDLDLGYEDRPSYFVEPKGDWGDGRIELVELATTDETNDNIVASWTPAKPPEARKPYSFAYRITGGLNMARLSPNGRVMNTFEAPAYALGSAEAKNPQARRFLIDFAGGDLDYYVTDYGQVEVVATATQGKILRTGIAPNKPLKGVRIMVDVGVKPGDIADVRLFLRSNGRTLTETWTYPCRAPLPN